jgi:hypothetical protein
MRNADFSPPARAPEPRTAVVEAVGVITRPRPPKAFSAGLGAFRTAVSVACLLVLPEWQGECAAVVIAAWGAT